jgi:uroporphyrinogen decarboxylase
MENEMTNSSCQSDFRRYLKVLQHDGRPDRVPLVEFYVDPGFLARFLGEEPVGAQDRTAHWRQRVRFFEQAGFDFVPVAVPLGLAKAPAVGADGKSTGWVSEGRGPISSMSEFDAHPWPKPEEIDFSDFEMVARLLPDGMGLVATIDGIFENTREIMGFETMAIGLYESPDLIRAVADRIGALLLAVHRHVAELPGVGAIHNGDDMSYKAAPMISIEHMRQYFLPWLRKFVDNAHAHGLPYTLHSDGDNHALMPDLLDMGIDGKHAFEDAAGGGVTEFVKRYGGRMAALGGVDMDILARATPDRVRQRVGELISECGRDGGFALGAGNSLADYIPIENYRALLEARRRSGLECGGPEGIH